MLRIGQGYDAHRFAEGGQLNNPADFVNRVNQLLMAS